MFETFLGTNLPALKIPEEDFWEICPQSVSCVFFSKTPYEKVWEIVLDRKVLSDLLRDMFERMFWVISCQICVWHNFGGHVSQDVAYQFIKEIHLTSCEDHSWGIVSPLFWYVPQKICGGKCAGLVRQKKRSGLFVEGILQQMFWGIASKISFGRYFPNDCFRKQLREIFFFLPKQCVKECLRLIFPALFRSIFSCFLQKHILKTLATVFLGDTPQKTCEQGGLSQTFLFTVHSFCCKIPNDLGMFRKMSLTKYLAENIPTKNPNNFWEIWGSIGVKMKIETKKHKWKLCPRNGPRNLWDVSLLVNWSQTSFETWPPKFCQTHIWQDITQNIRPNYIPQRDLIIWYPVQNYFSISHTFRRMF